MKVNSLSPIHLRMLLSGLCAVFAIGSAFAEGRAFLALVAAALGVVIILRLITLRTPEPATRFALSCLLGTIFVIVAWKKHWVGAAIVAFAVCSVLIGLQGLAMFRARPTPDEGRPGAGGSNSQGRE
jgi:hypothetical protein